MSNAHDTHDSHGGHGADHVPHVTPITHYFGIFGLLLTLTAITVGVSYMDFGPWNLVIAMLVATTKAIAVAAIFMHLLYDHRFHTVIFSFSVIFLAIFIVFTSFDTFARGRADLLEAVRPMKSEEPFGKTMRTMPYLEQHVPTLVPPEKKPHAAEHGAAAEHAPAGEHAPAPAAH